MHDLVLQSLARLCEFRVSHSVDSTWTYRFKDNSTTKKHITQMRSTSLVSGFRMTFSHGIAVDDGERGFTSAAPAGLKLECIQELQRQ